MVDGPLEGEIERILKKLMGEGAGAYYAVISTDGAVVASNLTPEGLASIRDKALSLAEKLAPGKFSLEKSEDGLITLFFRPDEGALVVLRAMGRPPGLLLLCAKAIWKRAEAARRAAEGVEQAVVEERPPAPLPAPAPTPPPTPGGAVYVLAPEFKTVDDILRAMPSIGVLSGSPILMFSVLTKLEKGPVDVGALVKLLEQEGVRTTEAEVREILEFLADLGVVRRR